MTRRRIRLDGRDYRLDVLRRVEAPVDAPRLLIPAYQPNAEAAGILRAGLRAIRHFTPEAHETWVIDNNSPPEHADWLRAEADVNVVFNRTEPLPPAGRTFLGRPARGAAQTRWASYANAIALEIGVRCIDPDTHYLMTLHMDTMPAHPGWLGFLRAQVDAGYAAAGVRMDTARTPEGVLHVLGYLVDFRLFRRLGLDFYPQLPQYDVGDRVSVALRAAGHRLYACPNTLWQPELIEQIPPDSPLRHFPVDRSFDAAGNVIFLHLGRGVRKATGEFVKNATPEEWVRCAEALTR